MAKNAKQNARKAVASKPAIVVAGNAGKLGKKMPPAMQKAIAEAYAQGPYKYHRASRKAAVHRYMDKNGRAAGIAYAAELGLAPGTAGSWALNWKRGDDGAAKFKTGLLKKA